MTVAIIFLIILFLILIFLLLPVKLNLSYSNEFKCEIFLGFIKIYSYEKKKDVLSKNENNQQQTSDDYVDKLKNNIDEVKDLFFNVFETFKKHLIFNKIWVEYEYGFKDAALTGVYYGVASTVINVLLSYLTNTFKVKKVENNINPKFNTEVQKFKFEFVVKFRLMFLSGIGVRLITFLKNLNKKVE